MTTPQPQKEKSIDMLVEQAHHFTQAAHDKPVKKASWATSPLTLGAVVIAVAAWGLHLTNAPSRDEIYGDLQQLLMQAKGSVEAAMQNRTTLPEHLDDPHLAAVIQYLPQWSDPSTGRHEYTLIARTGRYAIVWHSTEPERFERQE